MNRVLLILFCGLLPVAAFALKPVDRSALSTAPTHWDQTAVTRADGNRVIDLRDGGIRSVSMLREGPYAGTPEQAARAFLNAHTDWLGFVPTAANLRAVRTAETPLGHHVTFEAYVGGMRVYPGTCVVTLDRGNRVLFYASSLYRVPGSTPTHATLTAGAAVDAAHWHLQPKLTPKDEPQTELVIWAGDNRDYAVCWKVWQYMSDPQGDWEVLVDANTGAIRRVEDRACYIDGTGRIFRPDPLSTAEVAYGAAGYTDNNDLNSPQLHSQTFIDSLKDITFSGGVYRLQGPYCNIVDWDAPTGAPVTAAHPDSFRFSRDAQGFEDVNAYHHIDYSQRWIQSLGFTNIQNLSIVCDPHGANGADNSYYVPSTNRLAWGEGGVDDAEDADVIWHEYGHAIQSGSVPGWGGGDEPSMGEGFGDYWACSHSRAQVSYRNEWVFNWDGHNPFWAGRVVNANMHYPEDMGSSIHTNGQIWSQACYDAMVLAGRAVMDRLVLQHHFIIGTGASMTTAAQAILTADQNLNGGANAVHIYGGFVPRGLLTPPPVFAVTSPNGGELWAIDSTVTVTWSLGNVTGNILIELSRSGANGPWTTLVASTPNDGFHSLVATGPGTPQARVRITSLNDPAQTDMSDANFIISAMQTVLSATFEDGAAGWTHNTEGTWVDQWHVSTERANSPTHSYKNGDTGTGNYANRCDARLLSPVINNLPANATLSFYHQIQSELSGAYADSAYDGGVLEISVNGGAFALLTPSGGYPKTFRTLSGGGNPYSGPMPGVPCFAGNVTNWTRVEASLAAHAGQNVQLRFRFGSDAGTTGEGWYVDDVTVYAPASVSVPERLTAYRIGDSIVLRWQADGNPAYRIYSAGDPDGPFTTLEGTTTQTSFTVPGTFANAPKFFVVVGWDGN